MSDTTQFIPKSLSANEIAQNRLNRLNALRAAGDAPTPERFKEIENPKVLGVEITPYSSHKSFLRKFGEDAAMLAYGIPTGITQTATKIISNPIAAAGDVAGGFVQGAKDAVDPQYYKEHPLLAAVNLAGFVSPVAGAAKSSIIKTTTNSTLKTITELGTKSGIDAELLKVAVNPKTIARAVGEVYKTGSPGVALEVVRNGLSKVGIADNVVSEITSTLSKNISSAVAEQSSRIKALSYVEKPFRSSLEYTKGKLDPVRKAVFGSPANTAVGALYGAETVKKNPEGFLRIEQWAEAQVKERGLENNMMNRQRIMQEWVESDTQYASLTPEQRISHFENYAKQDLLRLEIHKMTGANIVTTKSLPQNTVDAMIQTLKDIEPGKSIEKVMEFMDENFGRDFSSHSVEISNSIAKNQTVDGLIDTVSKLGSSRSKISFAKFSPEAESLARELEGTGYRIAYAPKNKPLSFVSDTMDNAKTKAASEVSLSDTQNERTAIGNFIERIGLSPKGTVEGATEFAYREAFTQHAINDIAEKHGGVLKAGKISVPVERLYEWLDKKRLLFTESRKSQTFKIKTVFDITKDDLVTAGFSQEVAQSIYETSRKSLREIPASVTGMGDKAVNYMRSSYSGFGSWMSRVYDGYLKAAYIGRYDLSPFFAAQQWVETKINSSLLLKDARLLPGGGTLTKLGDWTAEKLGKELIQTKSFLKDVIAEPTLDEVALVQEEVLGSLQKTMFDSSRPDIIQVENAAAGGIKGLKDRAIFEKSIRSTNFWYSRLGQSNVRMATTLSKGLAQKFGFTVEEALSTVVENGVKKYKNPQVAQIIKEATQTAFHYKPGLLTSPLVKTMNMVWYPMRFQAKTVQLTSRWLDSLTPASRMLVMNNWVHFSNWIGTKDGQKWKNKNGSALFRIMNYTMSYEQLGKSAEAITDGKLFGGNAGMIGGVPFGFLANIARELAIIGEDEQINPKTGKPFQRQTPKKLVSTASLATAIEQVVIGTLPSTPFYTLTGGVITEVSLGGLAKDLIRQFVGSTAGVLQGKTAEQGKKDLKKQMKTVKPDYTRF